MKRSNCPSSSTWTTQSRTIVFSLSVFMTASAMSSSVLTYSLLCISEYHERYLTLLYGAMVLKSVDCLLSVGGVVSWCFCAWLTQIFSFKIFLRTVGERATKVASAGGAVLSTLCYGEVGGVASWPRLHSKRADGSPCQIYSRSVV